MMESGPPDAFGSVYRLLSGAVVPRPIAWVSSRSPDGRDNLAPYSFFNVVAVDPPILLFSPVGRAETGGLKDTARNILGDAGTGENGAADADGSSEHGAVDDRGSGDHGRGDDAAAGEFVIQLVDTALADAMNATSATLDHGESEFDHAGVTPIEAEAVDAAYVAEAPVAFECTLYEAHGVGGSTMVLGEVIHVHVEEELLTDGEFDVRQFDALGRLAGEYYCDTEGRFTMERPP
jgi:flavin reductase (DIM6/NTAB) family NADH-FMN oxidoreductase RutF